MIRARKDVDWTRLLPREDLPYLADRVDPDRWYPMEVFERLGNAILSAIALGDVHLVRAFGRVQTDQLRALHPGLLSHGDPVETLNRFRVLRSTFFDFEALAVKMLVDDQAQLVIAYGMGPTAEEAASYQAMGFFERLLELAGARNISARFLKSSWRGDPLTLLELNWTFF
jgi:hypothetical protein